MPGDSRRRHQELPSSSQASENRPSRASVRRRLGAELARVKGIGDQVGEGMRRPGGTRGEISEIAFGYCNVEECAQIKITRASLEKIQQNYYTYRGQPRFVHDVLTWDPESASVQLFKLRPELFEFFKAGGKEKGIYTLMLHDVETSHSRLDDLIRDPRKMMTGPFGYTVWAIHPTQLEGSAFDLTRSDNIIARPDRYIDAPEMMGRHDRVERLMAAEPDRMERLITAPNRMERLANIPRISETAANSGIPYIASLLDLKPEHLPWLEETWEKILEHIRKVYGANKRNVRIRVHKFYGEPTATIHLQARLKQALHPIEEKGSLSLEYVVEGLKNGKSGMDLVFEHSLVPGEDYGYVYTGYGNMAMMFKEKLGVEVSMVKNPYRLKSRYV